MCKPAKIERLDIIPMMNAATLHGFGNVEGSKTAAAVRGVGAFKSWLLEGHRSAQYQSESRHAQVMEEWLLE